MIPPTQETVLWRADALDQPGLEALARALAPHVQKGDVLALYGDLGAGKTTFARAFIRACTNQPALVVPSPTFTIAQSYTGHPLDIHHLDLFRLDDPDELLEIGFDEMRDSGLLLIEWPEKAANYLPAGHLSLHLALADAGAARQVRLTGPSFRAFQFLERVRS